MQFSEPEIFEQFLAPVTGEVRIRPALGNRFRAHMEMRKLKGVGLFTIEADSFSAQKAPRDDFYGFTIPLNTSFSVIESGREHTYSDCNAHMLSPGRRFNLQCKGNTLFMVSNFFVGPLAEYRKKLLQETSGSQRPIEPSVSLMSTAGSTLFRSVARAWTALAAGNTSACEMTLEEIEDELLASFVSLVERPLETRQREALPADYALRNAEDYICANLQSAITRDNLANIAGVSIRSLSRKFENKYGIGPMAFVRQRRLDACYARLRGSTPGFATVTDVALSHGFNHVGKFAIEYKKAFGESPSASLIK